MAAATSWHAALSFSFPPNPWRLLSAPPLLLPCTTSAASLPHTTQLSTQTCSLTPHPQCHPAPHNSISSPFSPHYPTLMPPFPTQKQFCTQPSSLIFYSTATQPHTTQLCTQTCSLSPISTATPPHPTQNNTAQYPALFSQPHPYCHPAPHNTAQYPELFSQPHPGPHNTAQYRWR